VAETAQQVTGATYMLDIWEHNSDSTRQKQKTKQAVEESKQLRDEVPKPCARTSLDSRTSSNAGAAMNHHSEHLPASSLAINHRLAAA
jgi:hypothetical protein